MNVSASLIRKTEISLVSVETCPLSDWFCNAGIPLIDAVTFQCSQTRPALYLRRKFHIVWNMRAVAVGLVSAHVEISCLLPKCPRGFREALFPLSEQLAWNFEVVMARNFGNLIQMVMVYRSYLSGVQLAISRPKQVTK
jgi:hypothetical protein